MSLQGRLAQTMISFGSLPKWVQIWVGGILVPVNALFVFFLDTNVGIAIAVAASFVVVTNVPIALYSQGMTKLMALPHLIWIPLEIYIINRLLSGVIGSGTPLFYYVWLVLVVNGISLYFDIVDGWKWLKGDRAVPMPGQ